MGIFVILYNSIVFLAIAMVEFCGNLMILAVSQTDKASILDEAIEYLKSLQMQVQV